MLIGCTQLVRDRSAILVTSMGLAFIQFSGIVLWRLVKSCFNRNRVNLEDTLSNEFIHSRVA